MPSTRQLTIFLSPFSENINQTVEDFLTKINRFAVVNHDSYFLMNVT